MKNWNKSATCLSRLAVVAAVAAGSMLDAAYSASKITWETSFATAQKKAKASGKPILLDFYGDGCPPCKQKDLTTYANDSVIRESKKWIMLKVNAPKQAALAKRYQGTVYPTTVFVRPDGRTITGFSGYVDASEMIKRMRAAAPKARK